jgi:putative DNA primase/helicase
VATFADYWDAGFTGVIPVIPPDAPLSAASKIRPEDRGKVPGRLNGQGTWGGFDWLHHTTREADLAAWTRTGAGIGLRAAECPGLDIDVFDERIAALVESTAKRVLGPAPRRVGRAPKRLLAYRTATPFGRIRLWFRAPGSDRAQLVEMLGDGQQYVVDGVHPGTRRPYAWDLDPTLIGAEGLTEIDHARAEALFAELGELLELLGCEAIEREGAGGVAMDRSGIDQAALRADIDHVAEAVALIPNTNELFPGRTDYIRMGCAIKAACADDEARGREIWLDWALRWEGNERAPEGNDPETAVADWGRMKPPFEVGADYLFGLAARFGFNAAAEDFEALEQAKDPDAVLPDGRPIKFSDAALALRFRRAFARDARYVDPWGRWMIWDGRYWQPDDTRLHFDLARRICSAASEEAQRSIQDARTAFRVASKVASAAVIGAVVKIAQADRAMASRPKGWDADPWALNTPDGIVDLRTGTLRPHERGARCTRITAVGPAAGDASCDLWLRFLDQVTGGDADLQTYLQRAVGYCLSGSIREHTLFFAHGPGGNGKGVFLNTVSAILGDYGAVASMDSFTVTHTERHPTDMAMLRGARLVTAQEVEEGRRWAEARIKALTGGDPITARFMRQDFFTYQPQFKLFVAGNHKPSLKNVDDAIRRRLHLIPFTFKPEQPDRDLPEKLKDEWPGVLLWAIAGCLEWQRVGLAPPPAVVEATAEYFAQQDPVRTWLEERCVREAGVKTTTRELFCDWKTWAAETGERRLTNENDFVEALKRSGFERCRQSKTGRKAFRGLRLINEWSAEESGPDYAG